MTLYSIKILNRSNGHEFINWCTDRWYSTDGEDIYRFTKPQVEEMLKVLPNHYVYKIQIKGSDGTKKDVGFMPKPKRFKPGERTLFKLNLKVVNR